MLTRWPRICHTVGVMQRRLFGYILSASAVLITGCETPCTPLVIHEADFTYTVCQEDQGPSTTTGDQMCKPPLDVPVCYSIPEAGQSWGPCLFGECGEGLSCKMTEIGSVCIPGCGDIADGCGCPSSTCVGGECNDEQCRPTCFAVGDECPIPGMVCDYNSGDPLCVHTAQ